MGSRRRGVTATSAEGTDFPDIPGAIGETGKPARPRRVGDNSRILRLALGSSPARPLGVGYDVFRAFTTRGARRIVMVDSLDKALELRNSGVGDYCIGERESVKPPGIDFGNSPAELRRAEVAGKTLIQTTTNGTAGITAARGADRIYAGALVTAEATVRAILRNTPAVITLVAMGRSNGTIRADEDELCALYLRACLEGRQTLLQSGRCSRPCRRRRTRSRLPQGRTT